MKNNQLLPFERNRYYMGKMLTSADFQTEQSYFNNKRRFINQTIFGAGIVCGCGVYSLDDLSIIVESGVAIDDYGREIVIDTSVVKKISAVPGFEELNSNNVYLCLGYKEKNIHSVYTVAHQETGEEYEYNRIEEGYDLFLMDADKEIEAFQMEEEFFTGMTLFSNEDYRVEYSMPARVSAGKYVKAVVSITKLSTRNQELSYTSILQMPTFFTEEGTHELGIQFDKVNLIQDETVKKEYWLKAQDTESREAELVLKAGSEKIRTGTEEYEQQSVMPIKISIEQVTPEELVSSEIGKPSLEMRNMVGKKDYIYLAEITLVRTESAYIIDGVNDLRTEQYISTPANYKKHMEYLSFYSSDHHEAAALKDHENTKELHDRKNDVRGPLIATGTLEIPLGDNSKKGDIRYSGEIMHGLGTGNVYVEVGYEYYEEDRALGANAKSTIYGRPELFQEEKGGVSDVETAVKVLNDKGSFVVAARLGKELDYLVLTYRWVAIKFQNGEEIGLVDDFKDKSISAETPTVVLGTKDSYFFNVVFHNMNSCSIAYELTESGSGSISSDGVYTAPTKEGVYEIRIYCTDMPIICTYAYAIVKKKGTEEE
ncbi:MAG: hypothetical protein PHE02_14690 [Lachnospiraceae bacterium]|nr:hypothetical protein [Lachnospiraceae bacterium]